MCGNSLATKVVLLENKVGIRSNADFGLSFANFAKNLCAFAVKIQHGGSISSLFLAFHKFPEWIFYKALWIRRRVGKKFRNCRINLRLVFHQFYSQASVALRENHLFEEFLNHFYLSQKKAFATKRWYRNKFGASAF